MFTGIVTAIGRVRHCQHNGGLRAEIACAYPMDEIAIGASIACNGACLTVTDKATDSFTVDVSAETLAKTTLAGWRDGVRVNLERSLRLGDELGGHIVSGHVDGVAEVIAVTEDGVSTRVQLRAPATLSRFIAPKGSVALDGISLTVNGVDGDGFDINLIPHTKTMTTWGDVAVGDRVNLEIDMLARYVARLQEAAGR